MVLKIYIWKERRFCSTVGLSFKIYNMLISWIVCKPCYQCVLTTCATVSSELVTFCKKYCLVKKNNSY